MDRVYLPVGFGDMSKLDTDVCHEISSWESEWEASLVSDLAVCLLCIPAAVLIPAAGTVIAAYGKSGSTDL
jgi:hypothetical protein